MNEVINNILSRRSIRDFSDEKVSKSDLELLIKAGLYAPSGMCRQTWKFVGVLNYELIQELYSAIGNALSKDNYNFYGAKNLILVSNEKNSKWSRDDNACALQNIMLAGHSIGIGTVWINQLLDICDNENIRPILNKLQIPENHEIYGFIALGYSKSEPRGIIEKKGEYIIID